MMPDKATVDQIEMMAKTYTDLRAKLPHVVKRQKIEKKILKEKRTAENKIRAKRAAA